MSCCSNFSDGVDAADIDGDFDDDDGDVIADMGVVGSGGGVDWDGVDWCGVVDSDGGVKDGGGGVKDGGGGRGGGLLGEAFTVTGFV